MTNSRRRRAAKQAKSLGQPVAQRAHDQTLDLAVGHHKAGRLGQARALYQRILLADPHQPNALHLLGVIAQHTGNNRVAVELIRKAVAVKPDYAEAHNNLGVAFQAVGRFEDAAAAYDRAIALDADFAEAHNNLGNALQDMGRQDAAIDSYDKALAVKPGYAEAHCNRGTALQESGRTDEAITAYRKAIVINPTHGEAHRHLAAARKFTAPDQDLETMEAAYGARGLGEEQRMQIAFGLGKAFEDLRRYDAAFDCFSAANAIRNRTCGFSITQAEAYFANLKKLFSPALLNRRRGQGSETPLFIIGMPRSGTTLVEQILASHPAILGAGEVNYLDRVVTARFRGTDGGGFAETIRRADGAALSDAGDDYMAMIRKRSGTARIITNKMPDNFMLIGMIRLILPQAIIIHCRRDPRDTCLSIYKNLFSENSYRYAYDLQSLGRYYGLYADLMDHWRRLLPGFIYDIRYEDLVADQENQTRALLARCGLEWDEACLSFHRTARAVQTLSAAQVRRPIYGDSVQSWKRYERQLAPLIEALPS